MNTIFVITIFSQISMVILQEFQTENLGFNWGITNIKNTLDIKNKPVLHYDIIFGSLQISVALQNSEKWVFSRFQVSALKYTDELKEVTTLLKESGNETTLRTALFLHPQNLSQVFEFCKMISSFYENPNASFDRKLLTVLTWTATGVAQDSQLLSPERLRQLAIHFPIDSLVYFAIIDSELDGKGNDEKGTYEIFWPLTQPDIFWEIYSVKGVGISQKVDFRKRRTTIPVPTHRNYNSAVIFASSVGTEQELNDPIAAFTKREDGTVEFSGGFSVSVLRDLANSLNFKIVAVNASDNTQDYPNGTVDGEGKLLVEGLADVSIFLTYYVKDLSKMLQPLTPVCVDNIQVFFRPPPTNSVRNIFTQPFATDMWIAFLVTCFLMSLSILAIFYIQKRHGISQRDRSYFKFDDSSSENDFRVDDTFFWILSVMCLKSYDLIWMKGAHKVVMICALATSGVVYAAYCSSIISTLAVDVEPIQDWEQILEQGYTILADPNVHYADFLFKESHSRKDYETMLSKEYVSDEDSIKKILTGKYAVFSTMDIVAPIAWDMNYTDQQICSTIKQISLDKVTVYCGFHVKKGSPLAESFNLKLLQLMEKGLTSKYLKNLYSETKPNCENKFTAYHNLSLRDSFFAFALLLVGFLVGFVGLFLERFSWVSSCRC